MLVVVSMPLVFFVLIRKLESGVSISSAFLFFFPFFNFFSTEAFGALIQFCRGWGGYYAPDLFLLLSRR